MGELKFTAGKNDLMTIFHLGFAICLGLDRKNTVCRDNDVIHVPVSIAGNIMKDCTPLSHKLVEMLAYHLLTKKSGTIAEHFAP